MNWSWKNPPSTITTFSMANYSFIYMEGGQNGRAPPATCTCTRRTWWKFSCGCSTFPRPTAKCWEVWCGLCLVLRHFRFQNIISFVRSNPELIMMAEELGMVHCHIWTIFRNYLRFLWYHFKDLQNVFSKDILKLFFKSLFLFLLLIEKFFWFTEGDICKALGL